MRLVASAFLALPLLAAAEQQNPLAGLFQKFSSYLPSGNLAHPVDATAAKIAGKNVHTLTLSNWQETMHNGISTKPSQPEEWWVFVTGGNKTCYGMCEKVEKAWNVSHCRALTASHIYLYLQ